MTGEIRALLPQDDLLAVSSIYELSWRYAYRGIIPQDYLDSIPHGRWANRINMPGYCNFVISENGRLVGTACICPSRWEEYPGYGEIVSIYLLPEYIGRGYGRALMERCIRELREQGYERILLWVLEENRRARRFYERCGFVCTGGYLEDNIGGREVREVMYVKEL